MGDRTLPRHLTSSRLRIARGEISLSPNCFRITFPPRIAHRLRSRAAAMGRSPGHLASMLVARALVPDSRALARLVEYDLDDAGLGNGK